jgi:hypothetical protein
MTNQVVSKQQHPLLLPRDNKHEQGPDGRDERKSNDDQTFALESSG